MVEDTSAPPTGLVINSVLEDIPPFYLCTYLLTEGTKKEDGSRNSRMDRTRTHFGLTFFCIS